MLEIIESSISLVSKGGLVMVPIILCSIIALTITIERFFYFRRTKDSEMIFVALKQLLEDEADDENRKALRLCKDSPGPVGRLMEAGVHNKDTPTWKLEEKLSVACIVFVMHSAKIKIS